MTYHKLLQKQINKYLPKDFRQHNDFRAFLESVNTSYNLYEKDKGIMNQAFQESEKEYNEVHENLKRENDLKERSIENLYESLKGIDDTYQDIKDEDKNDLLFISGYLSEQIEKRRKSEKSLNHTVELFKMLLANIQSGVMVEDENRKILFINQLFCNFFGIKERPETMVGMDCAVTAERSRHIFRKPDDFVNRLETIFEEGKIVTNELIETTDNRFFERDYIPIVINGELQGNFWKYTDVTEKKQTLTLIEQNEERNRLIMNAALNAIINIDSAGKITFWNRQAEKIFGWSQDEVLGQNLTDTIIPEKYASGHINGMNHYLETGEGPVLNRQLELSGLNRDGQEFPIEISILPINHNEEKFFCSFIQDISERKKAETSLKAQEEKYRNIIANMNMGLIEVDRNDIILYANQGFLSISGYELDEIIGKSAPEIFMYNEDLKLVKSKQELRRKGISNLYQLPIKNKKGELRWWAISGGPNYDDNGEWIGSIGIHLDITEQKRMEIELKNEKIKAQQASKSKEAFLAHMSHEIRTPLNAIVGFLRELSKQDLTAAQKEYVNNSNIASKHLLAIINNVLDISKIEAREMSLEKEDFIFENTINNVVTVMKPRAEAKELYLSKSVSEHIPKVLKGDVLRLEQILFNLIGNAVKFTTQGGVAVDCSLVESSDARQKIKISISDTGIGIDADFQKDIFRKFTQEDKALTTKRYGGTGLGLFITRELVELMGGTIEIESEKGKGTVFHVYLELEKGDEEKIQKANQLEEWMNLENVTILLVEDNILNRMVAQNSLKHYKCNVIEAENGLKAIEILKTGANIDLILMDIQMPEMDGIEATTLIREELKLDIPIIALTANAFKTEVERCQKVGMNDYVTKPFDEDVLINMIAKYTNNGKIEKIGTLTKLYDLRLIQGLSSENDKFMNELLVVFIEQVNETIQKTEIALSENNFTEVGRIMHKIRPSVESLRIHSISNELKQLEELAKNAENVTAIKILFSFIRAKLEEVILQLKENERDFL